MSTGREDDSRPVGSLASQRATARDVPAARLKDGAVGTVAPRGLRGPSLLPGQGAPERLVPEEVELAVLRDAETLDGPLLARVAARRASESRPPSPSPVPVEIPRARSVAPRFDDTGSTPPSPSARSIQSGTLLSIGSVDPRAPTELSLPSPRPLSVSERAAYLGPEAVVDRAPSVTQPRSAPAVVDVDRFGATERPTAPRPEQSGSASQRSDSSARFGAQFDSEAPPAQHFARAPRSYSPVSSEGSPRSMSPDSASPRSAPPRSAPPRSASPPSEAADSFVGAGVPAKFQIHSELEAVPREFHEDAFDLRSAATQREPLAGRKVQESGDWLPHSRRANGATTPVSLAVRASAPPTTVSARVPVAGFLDAELRAAGRNPHRARWLAGIALFAVSLALLLAWGLATGDSDPASAVPSRTRLPTTAKAATTMGPAATLDDAVPPARRPAATLGSSRTLPTPSQRAAAPLRSAAPAAVHPPGGAASLPLPADTASPGPDTSAKAHQSIY